MFTQGWKFFECIYEACGVPKERAPFCFLFQTNFKEKRAPQHIQEIFVISSMANVHGKARNKPNANHHTRGLGHGGDKRGQVSAVLEHHGNSYLANKFVKGCKRG